MYFAYGQTETDYLKAKDSRLAAVIDRLGHIDRTVDTISSGSRFPQKHRRPSGSACRTRSAR